MLSPDVEKRMKRVKMQSLFNRKVAAFYIPFSYLPITEDSTMPTFATDGRQIMVNPDFVLGMDDDELLGAFTHEILHNVLGHTSKDFPKVAQKKVMIKAQEIAVNNLVFECGLKLPDIDPIVDPNYKGWATLAIYKDLVEEHDETDDTSSGGCDCVSETLNSDIPDKTLPDKPTQGSVARKLSEVQGMLREIGETILTGQIGELIKTEVVPKIDWADELMDTFRKSFDGGIPDLSNPVAQYMPKIFIPKFKDESIDCLIIALDLSCSVTNEELAKAQSVIDEIKAIYEIETTTVITYNHTIIDRVDYGEYEDINIEDMDGNGGTRGDAVFEYLRKNNECPHALLVISDTEDDIETKGQDVAFPVIWLNTNNGAPFKYGTPPDFGKVISI